MIEQAEVQTTADAGWVYVLSNPHINALKVGFTLRTVPERIAELSNTSVPGRFVWEYGVHVDAPSRVEQRAHDLLNRDRTSSDREFFACSLALAGSAVLRAASGSRIHKTYDGAKTEGAARRITEQLELLNGWRSAELSRLKALRVELHTEAESLAPSFFPYALIYFLAAVIVLAGLLDKGLSDGVFFGSLLIGCIAGWLHQSSTHDRRKTDAGLPGSLSALQDEERAVDKHSEAQRRGIEQGEEFHLPSGNVSASTVQPAPDGPTNRTNAAEATSPPPSSSSVEAQRRQGVEEAKRQPVLPRKPCLVNVQMTRNFSCDLCRKIVNLAEQSQCKRHRCPAEGLSR